MIDANSDWRIEWTPLTDATAEERREDAKMMIEANKGAWVEGKRIVFTENEIRKRLGEQPLTDDQIKEAIDRMNPDLIDDFDTTAAASSGFDTRPANEAKED